MLWVDSIALCLCPPVSLCPVSFFASLSLCLPLFSLSLSQSFSVCLSACLSLVPNSLSICLHVSLSRTFSAQLPACPSVPSSLCPSVCLSVSPTLSICLPVSLTVPNSHCPSVGLSVPNTLCPSVCLSVSLCPSASLSIAVSNPLKKGPQYSLKTTTTKPQLTSASYTQTARGHSFTLCSAVGPEFPGGVPGTFATACCPVSPPLPCYAPQSCRYAAALARQTLSNPATSSTQCRQILRGLGLGWGEPHTLESGQNLCQLGLIG